MAALDKITREAIMATVKKATIEMQEMYHEQWLTADQLCQAIPFFTKEWLKEYGDTLPRQRFVVETVDGQKHRTRWGYPLHEINIGILEGRFQKLKVMKM